MNIVQLHERVRFWVDAVASTRFDIADINNAIPINGTLYIKIEGSISTHAGYINAMKITEHD